MKQWEADLTRTWNEECFESWLSSLPHLDFSIQKGFTGEDGRGGYMDFYIPVECPSYCGGIKGVAVEIDGHPPDLDRDASLWSLRIAPIHISNSQLRSSEDFRSALQSVLQIIDRIESMNRFIQSCSK